MQSASGRAGLLSSDAVAGPKQIDSPLPQFSHLPIEFRGILAYAEDADEFVRLGCRGYAGWRRDEWAYSPLFICGNFTVFRGIFPGF